MARRRRKKAAPAASAGKREPRDHMARVRVPDDVWSEFRAAAGATPINLVLGDLVQREVDRHRARRARSGSLDDQELLDALDQARELKEELSSIVAGLERRLDGGTRQQKRAAS